MWTPPQTPTASPSCWDLLRGGHPGGWRGGLLLLADDDLRLHCGMVGCSIPHQPSCLSSRSQDIYWGRMAFSQSLHGPAWAPEADWSHSLVQTTVYCWLHWVRLCTCHSLNPAVWQCCIPQILRGSSIFRQLLTATGKRTFLISQMHVHACFSTTDTLYIYSTREEMTLRYMMQGGDDSGRCQVSNGADC